MFAAAGLPRRSRLATAQACNFLLAVLLRDDHLDRVLGSSSSADGRCWATPSTTACPLGVASSAPGPAARSWSGCWPPSSPWMSGGHPGRRGRPTSPSRVPAAVDATAGPRRHARGTRGWPGGLVRATAMAAPGRRPAGRPQVEGGGSGAVGVEPTRAKVACRRRGPAGWAAAFAPPGAGPGGTRVPWPVGLRGDGVADPRGTRVPWWQVIVGPPCRLLWRYTCATTPAPRGPPG